MLTLEETNHLLETYDGNFSSLYPYIRHRLTDYTDKEIPFPGEFLFFEKIYLLIIKDLLIHNISIHSIVDIGCMHGFQTEWFKDIQYIGIDCYKYRFFNNHRDNVKYIVGMYPYINIDISNSIVISSMSLGFFNNFFEEENPLDKISKALSKAYRLYIATDNKLIDILIQMFDNHYILEDSTSKLSTPIYCFYND